MYLKTASCSASVNDDLFASTSTGRPSTSNGPSLTTMKLLELSFTPS